MPAITTNIAANSAVYYLNINSQQETSALSKLSSGSRIVAASDDAAGLAISTRISSDITTLQQAADYIMKLPEDVQKLERWQIAVENLINAAESGGGWLMFARIGVMRALNGNE